MMPFCGRGRNVDIVDADAGAADHLQVLRALEDLRRHFRRRADREPVEAADQLGELLLVGAQLGLEIDLDAAILEDLHGGGRERIGNEDTGGHDRVPVLGFQRTQRSMWGNGSTPRSAACRGSTVMPNHCSSGTPT